MTGREERSILELDGETLTYEQFRDWCLIPNRPAIVRQIPTRYYPLETLSAALDPVHRMPNHLMDCLASEQPTGTTDRLELPVAKCLCQSALVSSSVHHHGHCHRGTDGGRKELPEDTGRGEDDRNNLLVSSEMMGMTLLEFVEALRLQRSGDTKCTRGEEVVGHYLKDWHWQQTCDRTSVPAATNGKWKERGLPTHYEVPPFLGEDWLNAYIQQEQQGAEKGDERPQGGGGGDIPTSRTDEKNPFLTFGCGDDYRFVYLGPAASSFTPFHIDVCGTYSWSVNIRGKKMWYFPCMDEFDKLMEEYPSHRGCPFDIRTIGVEVGMEESGLGLGGGSSSSASKKRKIRYETVVQNPGDLIFVPSCYFHQVHNVPPEDEDASGTGSAADGIPLCISINHNWCNEYNILRMVDLLASEVDTIYRLVDTDARKALESEPSEHNGGAGNAWWDMVNRMLQSGGAWSLASMEALVDFSLSHTSYPETARTVLEEAKRRLCVILQRKE